MKTRQLASLCLLSLLLLTLAVSCGVSSSPENLRSTVDVLQVAVEGTLTARAAQGGEPEAALRTSEANATTIVQAAQSTQTAVAALSDDSRQATLQAFTPILAELPKYGVDPDQGRAGWLHPPVTVEVEGFNEFAIANQFMGVIAADFVISADVTWNTRFGDSGCGFVLRSDGNETAANQYVVIISRFAGGHIVFGTVANGEIVTGQDLYANGIDKQFVAENDSTNQLTVVGRGNRFFLYTNGTLIGEVDPAAPPKLPRLPPEPTEPPDPGDPLQAAQFLQAKSDHQQLVGQIQAQHRARLEAFRTSEKEFERGFTALLAATQSGKTTCQFNNAWLWLIE